MFGCRLRARIGASPWGVAVVPAFSPARIWSLSVGRLSPCSSASSPLLVASAVPPVPLSMVRCLSSSSHGGGHHAHHGHHGHGHKGGGAAASVTSPSATILNLPRTPLLEKYLSALRSGKLRHDPRQDGTSRMP
jgi:hypothetical protein